MNLSMTATRGVARLALASLLLAGCQKTAANVAPPAANAASPAAVNSALVPAAPPADAADAADVKAFLDGLYAHYKTSKNNTFNMFDTNAKEVLDESFIQLVKRDEKVLKGDVGVIDGDWLCACQDFESLKATVSVQSAAPTAATASADVVDTGMQDQGVRKVEFKLVKEDGRWRLDDIRDDIPGANEDWLRAQLEAEIKQLSAPGAKKADEAP